MIKIKNMSKSLQETANYPNIADGTLVRVEIPSVYAFDGKIVGLGANDINQTHLVECTDGFLPNETYPYKVCSMPLCYLSER